MPVRFNGTYNLEVTMRIFNSNGNRLTTAAYRARISATARDWTLSHDTGYLPAVGAEFETTAWHRHTWYGNLLEVGDPLTISLDWIGRESSSFWPDLSLQFQRVRLTLNTSTDPNFQNASLAHETWLYGEWSSPAPPPPPLTGR